MGVVGVVWGGMGSGGRVGVVSVGVGVVGVVGGGSRSVYCVCCGTARKVGYAWHSVNFSCVPVSMHVAISHISICTHILYAHIYTLYTLYTHSIHTLYTLSMHTHTHSMHTHTHLSQVGATCKHFAAYSFEGADGTTRFTFDAAVNARYGVGVLLCACIVVCCIIVCMH